MTTFNTKRGELIQAARSLLIVHRATRKATEEHVPGLHVAHRHAVYELERHVRNFTQLHAAANTLGDPVMFAACILIASGQEIDPSDL